MCFPGMESIMGLGMSVLQAGAEQSAKEQQYQQQVHQYQENVTNAEAADRDNQVALTLRQEQEAQAAGQKMQNQSVQGAIKASQLQVSAAGGGVTGISLDNILQDVGRTVDENQGVLRTNALATAAQLQSQKVASVDQDKSRIAGMAVPEAPDPSGALLGVAGAGLKAIGGLTKGGTESPSIGGGTGSNLFGMTG